MSDKAAMVLAGAILVAAVLNFLTNQYRAENNGAGGQIYIYNTVTGSSERVRR